MKWTNVNDNYNSLIDKIRKQDPYERLGIESGSSIREAKAAYRKKISLYHPDRTDKFMSEVSSEIVKLLNHAIDSIEKESKTDETR